MESPEKLMITWEFRVRRKSTKRESQREKLSFIQVLSLSMYKFTVLFLSELEFVTFNMRHLKEFYGNTFMPFKDVL